MTEKRTASQTVFPMVSSLFLTLARLLFGRCRYVILERDLTEGPLPVYASPLDLVFREVSAEEASVLAHLVPLDRKERFLREARRWFARGFTCLAAWHGNTIAAMDWISEQGDESSNIRMRAGSCFGMGLLAHEMFRGAGLALLGYSLEEARRRGYQRQVAIVEATNKKMLLAAIQMLGFRMVGRIDQQRIFRKSRWKWQVGDRSGRSRPLTL